MTIEEPSEQRSGTEASESPKDKSVNPWVRLFKQEPDRVIELSFTAAVVLFAFLGYRNSKSTSNQTDELIRAAGMSAYAAQQNVIASRNFADSASGIDKGVSGAVDKLGLQAHLAESSLESAAKQSRASLETTIEEFRQDQRPWVGIDQFNCARCSSKSPDEIAIGEFLIRFRNTGKTPAVRVLIRQSITNALASEPTPSFENLMGISKPEQASHIEQEDPVWTRVKGPQPFVLPPGVTHDVSDFQGTVLGGSGVSQSLAQERLIYIVGEITYHSL